MYTSKQQDDLFVLQCDHRSSDAQKSGLRDVGIYDLPFSSPGIGVFGQRFFSSSTALRKWFT